jgi:hypothetical protein
MSTLHAYRKNVKKHILTFDPEMYTNTYGSVIISAYINNLLFNNKAQNIDTKEVNKRWKNLKKNPKQVDFWIDDKDFIDKTLGLFDIKKPEVFNIAMVQSNYNVLFMPYFEDQLWPLRDDGCYPQTAKTGKIYPIDFTNKSESATNSAQKIDLEKKE